MIRHNNIYDKVCNINNLYEANRKARKGKFKKNDVIAFNNNLEKNIFKLHLELISETYTTSDYYHFTIKDSKERNISKLPYKDRVVQHSLLKETIPIFTKCFISQTYSCIEKRGIHKALNTLKQYLKNKNETVYCLKVDIKKFYPSVNNDILKNLLRRKFKDNRLLALFDNIIDSNIGLPLGNYTSQWLGNYYLNGFDH